MFDPEKEKERPPAGQVLQEICEREGIVIQPFIQPPAQASDGTLLLRASIIVSYKPRR
jgi:hypothetical protein